MKKIICALTFLILCIASLSAQPRLSKEQVQQARKEYLTKVLDLTSQEIDKLMPILEEMESERFRLWQEGRQMRQCMALDGGSHSDAELRTAWEQWFTIQQRLVDLDRIYYRRCEGILPLCKLVLLPDANKRFAHRYLQRTRGNRE